ncbi:hypothetical protein NQ318_007913 [Aromia moschata]|uniref:Transposase Tc1-like domain-containing protein n=1 Tax=Aromia moschata TaxID=1265417 RepID=A0AAV8XV52_9CUCU|nr:hypothetical protein NQ318_007913 [Aromia moschata]
MAHLTVTQRIEISLDVEIRPELSRWYAIYLMQNMQITLSPNPQLVRLKTGDVKDLPKSGPPKITQDKKIDIVLSLEENSQSTSTLVASENEVSQTTVLRILRKENYHPYKFQLVQELSEDDTHRRLQFCKTMMNLCQTNPNLHQQILFSDEATFCLNGTVNRQNCSSKHIGSSKHILNIRRN